MSRSGYYKWCNRDPSARDLERERLIPKVQEIHRMSGGTYGTRRISAKLECSGVSCGRDKARTLMRLANVTAKQSKKFKITTDSKHNLPVSPNLLDRQFEVSIPDQSWVSDITYIWTREGWLYLSVIIDLYSRKVVGWSVKEHMRKELVLDALEMAILIRNPGVGLIFHSDRGSQYCSTAFQEKLRNHKMLSSMSGKGDCWDNAVAESFFGSMKTERIYGSTFASRSEGKNEIVAYIEMFYNSHRLHSYLGYLSPNEFERIGELREAA